MSRFLPRIEKRECVPLVEATAVAFPPLVSASDTRLATDVRREVLGVAGAHGLVNAFLIDRDQAIIGWLALGTPDPCREAAQRLGNNLSTVAQLASKTLQMALALAQGCIPNIPRVNVIVGLTRRERQIVELVARGLSDLNVAQMLDISEATVGTHLRNIYSKLRIHSRFDLIGLV